MAPNHMVEISAETAPKLYAGNSGKGEIFSEMAPNPRVEIVAVVEGNSFRDGPNHMVDGGHGGTQ